MAPDFRSFAARVTTGIQELDDGHQAFVQMAERLSAASATLMSAPERERVVPELLQETISTVTQHFVAEERLMKSHGYRLHAPERFADHLEAHADFTAEVCRLVCALEHFTEDSLRQLGRMLLEFAAAHGERHDQDFVRHIATSAGR